MKHSGPTARSPRTRLAIELLEDRAVPAALSIGDATAVEGSTALRFIDRFVAEGSGGLNDPNIPCFGPDVNQDGVPEFYVPGGASDAIHRYDGRTGAFIDVFVPSGTGGLDQPRDIAFGPDGSLYVSSELTNQVLRYDGSSGAFLGVVASGLSSPHGLMFGSDGSLYISNQFSNEVLRYRNGSLSAFVTAGSGGLLRPRESEFGPDGNGDGAQDLYVASRGANGVYRYDGLTGAFIDKFAASPAGLPGSFPTGGFNWLQFGADGYLYTTARTASADDLNTSFVRFNAVTGAFVDTFPLGRDGWSFIIGPDGLIYNSGNGGGNFVERFGPASLAAFTVSLDAPSATPVTVQFATADGTALAGSDYVNTSGTITFAPGQTSRTILVPTVNDGMGEGPEMFSLTLSNPVGATFADGTGVGTITDEATKFFVTDDGSLDRTYRYGSSGNGNGTSSLAGGNTAPRGAASTAAGVRVWVADSNKTVYIYDAAGNMLGSWTAGGLTGAAQVEGITTNGTDIWIVDAKQDRVYRYAGAATRLSGSQNATSNFALNSGNKDPKDLVTDGASIWVVNDSTTDKVFKYTLTGSLLGSWTMTGGGGSPTGITLDPTGSQQHLWVVDSASDRVYEYDNARSQTSGTQSASANFALAVGNTNPQGIADPPALTFGTPFNSGPGVNTNVSDNAPTVTADGLSLLFYRTSGVANALCEILEATRSSTDVPFASAVSAGAQGDYQAHPSVSLDGLTLLYSDEHGSGLYQATRSARNQPFSGVTSLGNLLPGQIQEQPSLSADGLTLFFTAYDNVQKDIYQATRPTLNGPWGNVIMLGSDINVPGYNDAMPSISSDGLKLFFNSNRPGGFGQFDLYVATRPSLQAPWEPAVNCGPQVNTAYDDKGPSISPDGGLLYFHSNRPGGFGLEDLYAVTVGYGPLQVSSTTINGGAAQRSRVIDIRIAFTGLATLPANPADAFRLTRLGPGGSSQDLTLAVDLSASTATQTIARLTFGGALTEFGSLTDGLYRLTILSSKVSGAGQPLDGDANGTPGGDFTLDLHRLYGDTNGDKAVNGLDLTEFRKAFGASAADANYRSDLDFNGDGAVNGSDLAEFRTRFGTILP